MLKNLVLLIKYSFFYFLDCFVPRNDVKRENKPKMSISTLIPLKKPVFWRINAK